MEDQGQWVFFLKLSKELPSEYVTLSTEFHNRGKTLIPIALRSLLDCIKETSNVDIVLVVKSSQDLRYFNRRIKKIVKYLIRTGRVNLYIASSFTEVNDPTIMKKDYYYFAKLPVSYSFLCDSISRIIDVREKQMKKWPGGDRPRLQLAG